MIMKTFYKRNLPHFIPEGYVFFITSRLVGSLPKSVIEKLKKEKQINEKHIGEIENLKVRKERYYEQQKLYFSKFDNALDNYSRGPYWLKNKSVAEIIKEAFHYRDKKVYDLFAYTIMPNHIHFVIKPIVGQHAMLTEGNYKKEKNNTERLNRQLGKLSYNSNKKQNIGRKTPSPYLLGDIMESLKGFTAFECNKILNRKGVFWQHENYDHVIRNQEELVRIIKYIMNNPVKAHLCEAPEDWRWNYYNPDLIGL